MQLGHKIEIHAIETTDECRRQEDDIDDGKYFDDSVLLDINQTKEGILEVVKTVKTKSRIVEKWVNILDNHRKPRVEFFGEEITFEDIGNNSLFIHYVLSNNGNFFL